MISKWINDLKVRPKNLKFWGKLFQDTGTGNSLLNNTGIIARKNKEYCLKLKTLCSTEETITRVKR